MANQEHQFKSFDNLDADHPVRVAFEENLFLKDLLRQILEVNLDQDRSLAFNLLNQIAQVNIRYTRKENQLFPYLEKRGWFGPSQGMWRFHDENRGLLKALIEEFPRLKSPELQARVEILVQNLVKMIQVEEHRLYPNALQLLQPQDWEEMKTGEGEIGWMHRKSPAKNTNSPPSDLHVYNEKYSGRISLDVGALLPEQINLLLQVMPFDLTYVDENDRVVFYNRGEDRVFPRSAGVIGREVRFCHPPKSVDTVLRILEEFRSGRQSVAEFWISYRGRKIHIRYFAVRDQQKNYKGVIEVSQDITEIQKIEGERRLLEWESNVQPS